MMKMHILHKIKEIIKITKNSKKIKSSKFKLGILSKWKINVFINLFSSV